MHAQLSLRLSDKVGPGLMAVRMAIQMVEKVDPRVNQRLTHGTDEESNSEEINTEQVPEDLAVVAIPRSEDARCLFAATWRPSSGAH